MNKALFFVCISLFLGNAYLWAQQDCEPTESVEAIVKFNTTPYPPEGALSGVFSVSATKKVYFSKGNLQYRATSDGIPYNATTNPNGLKHEIAGGGYAQGEFRFAEHQYDAIRSGTEATNMVKRGTVENGDNTKISSTYSGWIDHFCYGTSGYNNKNPYDHTPDLSAVSITNDDNYDWGYYNAISNGGNEPGIWRCLTTTEWVYLLKTRAMTNGASRFVRSMLSLGVTYKDGATSYPLYEQGLLIFPDDWKGSSYPSTLTFESLSTLEQSGVVWIPSAGNRSGTSDMSKIESYSSQYAAGYLYYWTANSCITDTKAYALYMDRKNAQTITESNSQILKTYGCSVRLVADKP